MRIIIIGIALFAFISSAHAQNDELAHLGNAHGRYTFWWMSSPAAVRDSMRSRPEWQSTSYDGQKDHILSYVSRDGNSARFFTFSEGSLIKQSYLTIPSTSEYDRLIGWYTRTIELSDGRRFDRNSGLVLKEVVTSNGTMFTIEPDWDDEQAIKLSK